MDNKIQAHFQNWLNRQCRQIYTCLDSIDKLDYRLTDIETRLLKVENSISEVLQGIKNNLVQK